MQILVLSLTLLLKAAEASSIKWESWQRVRGLVSVCWHNKQMKLYCSLFLLILNWTNAVLSEKLSKKLMLLLLSGGSEIKKHMFTH